MESNTLSGDCLPSMGGCQTLAAGYRLRLHRAQPVGTMSFISLSVIAEMGPGPPTNSPEHIRLHPTTTLPFASARN